MAPVHTNQFYHFPRSSNQSNLNRQLIVGFPPVKSQEYLFPGKTLGFRQMTSGTSVHLFYLL